MPSPSRPLAADSDVAGGAFQLRVQEIVVRGEALADALQRLILDKELRVRMGREGRLRVERIFTKEIIVRQTLDMYGAALGRKL